MSHDDILNAKILKNLLKKDWRVPRDYHEKKIMKKISDMIMQYSDLDVGISHKLLAESIGRDRKTIRPYLKRLIKMGLVTRDQGKHGKYFPTTKRHRGTVIGAEILAESFREKFLDAFEEIFVYSPHFKRNIPYEDERFDLEDALFSFSNIVGGWITYVLIQSMNPTNYLTDDVKDDVGMKLSVAAFIEDAISVVQRYLLLFFNYYVSKFLETLHKEVQGMKGGFSTSNILKVFFGDILLEGKLFDEGSISELNDAFSKVYPNLSHELEKTRLEQPTLVKHETDRRKRLSEAIRKQENCKPHYYVPVPDDRGKGYSTFRCRKCGKPRKKNR